ncbi:hypothetical protein HHK36_029721 [Tetracentron sinense]|uniref:Thioredoxin domain-containing protein n=1 Tax=Tetracentron sinense TaxID=13715 RepID=A0A835CZL5_TETSI|nr:hypothetical protein HHK36_029721 [Tetracentron sinense]
MTSNRYSHNSMLPNSSSCDGCLVQHTSSFDNGYLLPLQSSPSFFSYYSNPLHRPMEGLLARLSTIHPTGKAWTSPSLMFVCFFFFKLLIFFLMGLKMVIDFTATWCKPCRLIEPTIEELASKFRNVLFVKIDVDELMVSFSFSFIFFFFF